MTDNVQYIVLATVTLLLTVFIYITLDRLFMPRNPIVVVFDLDETLGSFVQLGVLKDVIERYEKRKLTTDEFNALVDNHPEFIRPGIIDILRFVVKQKAKGYCDGVMIYTNNQGPREWAESISSYFAYVLQQPVFDHIIAAFKVNGHIVEPGRTSHDKSYKDFITCSKMPPNTQVFFLDDVNHPLMQHKNVYYVNLKPYSHRLPISQCLARYYPDDDIKQLECLSAAQTLYHAATLRGEQKTPEEQDVDRVIGKYMLKHLEDFFRIHTKSHSTTRKKHSRKHSRSKKRSSPP